MVFLLDLTTLMFFGDQLLCALAFSDVVISAEASLFLVDFIPNVRQGQALAYNNQFSSIISDIQCKVDDLQFSGVDGICGSSFYPL